VKFLVDNQLPGALARFLASRGVDCQHVLDLDMGGASDSEIWEHASKDDSVVISKDEDFLYLAKAPEARARLIWVRLGNCRTKALLAAVERMWQRIEAALKSGDRIIELR
jgi:predicted nuclease of predicted toxin-antitoxin system